MITSPCPICSRMRDDDGNCSTCKKPLIDCEACVDYLSTELHTCGKAVSFPAEADTYAATPDAMKRKIPHAA